MLGVESTLESNLKDGLVSGWTVDVLNLSVVESEFRTEQMEDDMVFWEVNIIDVRVMDLNFRLETR